MSVTAVPLHPLTKWTVPKLWIGILLLVLVGAGLAWVSTRGVGATPEPTWIAGNDGLRYSVWDQGRGAAITPDDVFFGEIEAHDPSGKLVQSTALTGPGRPMTIDSLPLPPAMRPVMLQMRAGSFYQIQLPLRSVLPPGAASPNPAWKLDDNLEVRVKINSVLSGGAELLQQMQEEQMMRQQAMQQQMQQQMQQRGGRGGAGGAGAGAGAGGGAAAPGGDDAAGAAPVASNPHPTR